MFRIEAQNRNRFIVFYHVILLALEIVLFYSIQGEYSRFWVSVSIIICLLESIFIISSIRGALIRPITILVLSYFIVNCQLFLDLVLGLTTVDAGVFVSSNIINKGAVLSSICITSLAIGYIGSKNLRPRKQQDTYSSTVATILGVFFVLAFVYWLLGLTAADFNGENYLTSGSYDNSTKGYREVLLQTFQLLALAYYCKKGDDINSLRGFLKTIPKSVLIVSFLYIVIRLMSGDRGPAIYTALLYLFVYTFKVKKTMAVTLAIPVLIVASIVLTSISISRVYGSQLSFFEKITYVFNDSDSMESYSSLSPFTLELANSVGCTQVVLDEIENHGHRYHYGITHFCYLVKFIPFLGSKIVNILGIPSTVQSSSEFVTVTQWGRFYHSGMGTSTIADEYLEFGVIGVVLGLLIIGLVFKKVDSCLLYLDSSQVSVYLLLFVFAMCFGCLYIPRGIFIMFVRQWFYGACVYFMIRPKK